jgi:CHAT domain-containing protein
VRPSISVRSRAALRPALVVGNPAMPILADGERLEPLPHAWAGAAWLARTLGAPALTSGAASETAVRAAMPDAQLVHLGTHGRAYAAEARARLSWVALAPGGDGEDGLLTAGEILAGPPLRAELVTLGACQTALGDATDAEGTVGLQRAFLARGARSVLVSLWRVNDEATERMLRAFYARWPDSSTSKAAALRSAQRQLARDAGGRTVHPYFWAGFQLVGAR